MSSDQASRRERLRRLAPGSAIACLVLPSYISLPRLGCGKRKRRRDTLYACGKASPCHAEPMQHRMTDHGKVSKTSPFRKRLPAFVVKVLTWLTIKRLTNKNARVIEKS